VKRIATGLLIACAALPAAAQETTPLTDVHAAAIMEFYNHPTTTRIRGETWIARDAVVSGNLASLGGPLVVAGTVEGDVVVINGDLRVLPGGRIDGTVRVTGGRISLQAGTITGAHVVYPEALRFRREGDRLVSPAPDAPGWPGAGMATWFGRTDFILALDGSYNRVEGLPVTFGPRLQLGHSNPTVIEARAIYRTRTGLQVHPNDFGHDIRLEQYLGGHRGIVLGLGLHRLVDDIEGAGLSDTENSLATFVLHQDFRDHYARRGWSGYVRFVGATRPYEASIEYRDEYHYPMDAGTPWSLIRNDQPWRPQPEVARGDLRSVRGVFRWDTRNDPTDPAAGWLVSVNVEQGLGGSLRYEDPQRVADSEFTAVGVDARRYLRLDPRSRVAVRAHASGSPDAGALPPQRQHTLGGQGALPGYGRFHHDCGARAEGVGTAGFYPYYGCDRVLLLQGEYRYALLTDPDFGRRLGLGFNLFAMPELVLFANAGRAWIEARSLDGRFDLGPRSLQTDVGVGLRMGPLGMYIASPLSGSDRTPNFFIRLGPRL
jgi:hypothetical protein